MKKLLVGFLSLLSLSSFAFDGVVDKLSERGILCSYEEYLRDSAYQAFRKEPQNQELKNELNRTQRLSSKCLAKAEKAADLAKTCQKAIDNIADVGSLCTAENIASDIAFFLVKNNSSQGNRDLLSGAQRASSLCVAKAYDVCK